MVRAVLIGLAVLVTVAGVFMLVGDPAQAQPGFKKQFDTTYMKKGTALHTAYKGRSSCNVCHIGGTDDRENRNNYGKSLAKFLNEEDGKALTFRVRKKNKALYDKTVKKVQAALKKVEKMSSIPGKKDSPTFGDLIKSGKLPLSPKTLPAE